MKESVENYLETIYMLSQRMENVRSIDIVKETGFSKPSISVAMKKLREDNLISVDNHGYITFTEEGSKLAKNVFERHKVLTEFFIKIGVPEDIAELDACKMEHDIHSVTFDKLKQLIPKL